MVQYYYDQYGRLNLLGLGLVSLGQTAPNGTVVTACVIGTKV